MAAKERKRKCGICKGNGVVPSTAPQQSREGADGRKVVFNAPMARCVCNGGAPVVETVDRKELRDWRKLAAADGGDL